MTVSNSSQAISNSPDGRLVGPPKLLLIDDDAVFAMVSQRKLEANGYDVNHSMDAQSAYALMSKRSYDLVIVDLSMPELDGLDLIGCLRQAETTRNMPIIVVTSSQSVSDLRSAIGLDVSWYVNKPINWPLFLQQIEQTIEETLTTHSPRRTGSPA